MDKLQQRHIHLHQTGDVATLAEHQQALCCLLQEFDRVCKALDITYYLFAGTLLGAVRHEGFIPWDDDLDVIMERSEYRRFMEEAPKLLDCDGFYLQEEFTEHYPMFFSKLHLNGTTCLEKHHPKDPLVHQGVYMDIFPFDHAYGSRIGRYVQFLCSKVVIAKGLDARGYETDSTAKKFFMVISRVLPRSLFHRIVRGPKKRGKYIHCFLGGASKLSKSVFPADLFDSTVPLPFAGSRYSAPGGYDEILTILYCDYMTIPPEEDRKCKQHAILVDLKRSYEHYGSYRDGMKFDNPIRSIR